ncbi:hypothetical protein ACFYOT_25395 [Saccharothrix saharensis]|uniref:hypothetical protein n=1 Tax=Saccharothrix saharensis TaxID=571190 RepID=UPI0036CC91C7
MNTTVLHTKETADASAWAGRDRGKRLSRLSGRRLSAPHLLVGVLLVITCAGGGVLAMTHRDDTKSVLALAQPVAVGQVLTAQHLTERSLTFDSNLGLIPATEASTVVGVPASFSLPEGSLVTRSMLGPPQSPPRGRAIAALGLKPGQFPPELSPGTAVLVLATPTPGMGTEEAQHSSWAAVVVDLVAGESGQNTVVSLQLTEADARAMASAPPGQFNVVTIAGGER